MFSERKGFYSIVIIRGLSLVEMLLVLSIIGILGAVAYPSYLDHFTRVRRNEAKAALMELSQYMEKNFVLANRYDRNTGGESLTLPFTQLPRTGTNIYYNFTLANLTQSAYVIKATPSSIQSADGILELTHAGVKRWDKNNDGDTTDSNENCWEKTCQ